MKSAEDLSSPTTRICDRECSRTQNFYSKRHMDLIDMKTVHYLISHFIIKQNIEYIKLNSLKFYFCPCDCTAHIMIKHNIDKGI